MSAVIVDPEDRARVAGLRASLAAAACARLHPQLYAWTDAEGRMEHVLTDIDAALARCGDLAIARRDALRFGGPDAAPADYFGRLLALDGALAAELPSLSGSPVPMARDDPWRWPRLSWLPPSCSRARTRATCAGGWRR